LGARIRAPCRLKAWVAEIAALTSRNSLLCDGSEENTSAVRRDGRRRDLRQAQPGEAPELLPVPLPPSDVARVEDRTYICSEKKDDAGPRTTGRREEMRAKLKDLFAGCMRGRMMYVIPSAWPDRQPDRQVGIEISDSPYVVTNMKIMTRMGRKVSMPWAATASSFPACIRSAPLAAGRRRAWPCEPDIGRKYIVHFPESREIVLRLGYGGNALLGKKCLRCASLGDGARPGWLPSTC